MTADQTTPSVLSAKFIGLVALVFLLQVALVFWLSDRTPSRPARHLPQAGIVLVNEDPHEILRFRDPSLFGLPHIESFSGDAWLRSPPLEYKAFDWNETFRWLPLQFRPVNIFLAELLPNEARTVEPVIQRPEPDLAVPGMLNVDFLPEKSLVSLVSGSSDFDAAIPATLPSWQHTDLVPDTIVQLVANEDGKTLSTALLSARGYARADAYALNFAEELRIAPAGKPGQLRWAILRFEWHTIPPQTPATEGKAP